MKLEIVRNVGIKGKAKLADRWENDVCVVVHLPTPDIPIYEVKQELEKGKHSRNLLFTKTGIPLTKKFLTDVGE